MYALFKVFEKYPKRIILLLFELPPYTETIAFTHTHTHAQKSSWLCTVHVADVTVIHLFRHTLKTKRGIKRNSFTCMYTNTLTDDIEHKRSIVRHWKSMGSVLRSSHNITFWYSQATESQSSVNTRRHCYTFSICCTL